MLTYQGNPRNELIHVQFCLELADEFLEAVADVSCQLAKRRGGDRLEVKDIQLHLGACYRPQHSSADLPRT